MIIVLLYDCLRVYPTIYIQQNQHILHILHIQYIESVHGHGALYKGFGCILIYIKFKASKKPC